MLKGKNYIHLQLRKNATQTFYLKLYGKGGLSFLPVPQAISFEFVTSYDRKERFVLGGIIGMMLIIVLFYGIIGILLKERSYFLFLLFVLSYALLMINMTGYGNEMTGIFIFKDSMIWDDILIVFPVFFFLLFGNVFLDLKHYRRFWYRAVNILALVILLCIIIEIVGGYAYKGFWHTVLSTIQLIVMTISLVIGMGIHLVTSVLRLLQKFKPAWYFIAANLLAIAFLMLNDYLSPGIEYETNASELVPDSILLGVAVIQFLVFSVALGMKIRINEKEKEAARQQVIDQLKENEKLKDKVNRELEQLVKERTHEISQQKDEIEAQRDDLAKQRDLVAEQKKEITDSITYAKRIQTAVLPSEAHLTELLPEHFVLFKPRDIVSGDFYWIKQVKNFTVVVAADCTGHGVPGAFMSMLENLSLKPMAQR